MADTEIPKINNKPPTATVTSVFFHKEPLINPHYRPDMFPVETFEPTNKPKIIGNGILGCVYAPQLHCEDGKDETLNTGNRISKAYKKKYIGTNDEEGYKIMEKIDPYHHFHLGNQTFCKPKNDEFNLSNLLNCGKNLNTNNATLLLMEYGGITLDKFIEKINQNLIDANYLIDVIVQFWFGSIDLIYALCVMFENNVSHNDLHDQNILIDTQKNIKFNVIDFGLVGKRNNFSKNDFLQVKQHLLRIISITENILKTLDSIENTFIYKIKQLVVSLKSNVDTDFLITFYDEYHNILLILQNERDNNMYNIENVNNMYKINGVINEIKEINNFELINVDDTINKINETIKLATEIGYTGFPSYDTLLSQLSNYKKIQENKLQTAGKQKTRKNKKKSKYTKHPMKSKKSKNTKKNKTRRR
jgi:hypothetical protein